MGDLGVRLGVRTFSDVIVDLSGNLGHRLGLITVKFIRMSFETLIWGYTCNIQIFGIFGIFGILGSLTMRTLT